MTLGRAAALLEAVQADPRRTADAARDLVDDGSATPLERIGALWALGRALSELDEVEAACRTLGEAADAADGAAEGALAAEIRVSRSVCLLTAGDAEAARAELDLAEEQIPPGGPTGRLVMQRGLLEIYGGRLASALEALDRALPMLVDAGDDLARCRLLSNRGVILAFLGQLDRAQDDLDECQSLATRLGQDMAAAAALHNLGFVRGRRGDVPRALDDLRTARRAYEALGAARLVATLDADLGAVLLTGGLAEEAAEAAARAVDAASAAGNRLTEAEARLLLAEASLAAGRTASARRAAQEAADTFRAAGRDPWATIADHLVLRADVAGGAVGPDDLDAVLGVAEQLDAHGWTVEAAGARALVGRLGIALGRVELARRALERSAADRCQGPAALRASAWLATAMLRAEDGDRAGARRALAAGMRVIAAHQAALGSTELRVHAAAQGRELAGLGLRLAVEDGSPEDLLRWAERWRARALSLPPVRPPRDGRLAALLDDLRALDAAHRELLLGGAEVDDAERARRIELEDEVRAVSRSLSGSGAASERLDLGGLRAQLGATGAQLVELVEVDGELHAVVAEADPATWRWCALGPVAELSAQVAQALASIRRLAVARSSPRALAAAVEALGALGRAVDQRVVAPLGLAPDGPVVIVPTGVLQRFPWSVVPSLTARPVVVAPSAALWVRAARPAVDGRVVLVGGPDLEHVERELELLSEVHPDALVLGPEDCRAGRVLDAASGARMVHLAAHGTLRSDSPLFTSLQLADGPLTVYDLEHLEDPPRTVVLPACDAGASTVATGDELIGSAVGLLSMGVSQVVAPLTMVPDEATVDLVVDLHRAVAGGLDVPHALAAARTAALARGGPQDVAAAHAFVVLGGS
ncbi:CHAT domain-containing protein [Actinomarinicola tropica]|uniref:CHAT domain-containing protein n=1 Tax=Actinomarinicola tropica TaxID=2789776 RepID=A0A5Q2RKB9_9ACTN|nr:CHAT domain-containing protein [Actinomarinicola tropica]QGG95021.1 CHAT domain-containing protein [Actinomarinicola tropica]